MKKIIVYDFDKTVYGGETSTDFMLFFLKRNPRYIFRLYNIFPSIWYYKKDLKKSKEHFFKILEGLDLDFVREEIKEFWKVNSKKIFPWIEKELEDNMKEAQQLILISATPAIFLEEISKSLGFHKLIATDFVKCSVFNPKILGKNCKGEEKVVRLNQYIQDYDMLAFYSDSMSDKPLFDLAKKKFYINKGIKEEGLPNEKY